MHRIGQKTTLQERVTIGKLAIAGRTDAQIAMQLGYGRDSFLGQPFSP